MDAERYARVKAVFLDVTALELDERPAFLEQVCGSDAELRKEVESLLAHSSAGPVLETLERRPTPLPTRGFGKALEPGDVVSDYVVEAQIGAGTFGAVYRGVHRIIEKRAAIKVLSEHYSSDPQIVSRFVSEARAVNKIDHSGIIDIFAFGQLEDGRHYHIMELVDGPTLAELIAENGRFTVDETLELLDPIARALDAAGAAGVAHRDLKPSNVLVPKDEAGRWSAKLLDFGVAKLLDEDHPRWHHTDTGVTMGTPSYMAPEQCTGAQVDHRADIYAFGVVVFQMLTGQLPFPAPNAFMVMARQVNDPAPSPHTVEPSVSEAVGRVVQWMLAKAPDQRPASLAEAMTALADASRGSPVDVPFLELAGTSDRVARDAVTADLRPPTLPLETMESAPPPPTKKRPLALWGGVALAVLAVALVAMVQSSVRDEPEDDAAERAAVVEAPAVEAPSVEAPPAVAERIAATPESVEAAAPSTVRIELVQIPANARVEADGVLLRRGPGPVEVSRSDAPASWTVRAPGHATKTVRVDLSEDREVTVRLRRRKKAPQPDAPDLDDLEPWEAAKED
ncbi:MAG: serine/threonine-protein kinase [Deltaproteobacteria bacterium]|jgi:serine/threonine protein kinase